MRELSLRRYEKTFEFLIAGNRLLAARSFVTFVENKSTYHIDQT